MTKMAAAIPRSLSIGCTTLLDVFARLLWPVRVNRDSPLLRLSTLFPPSELTAAPATEIKKKPDLTRAALGAAILEASALADLPFQVAILHPGVADRRTNRPGKKSWRCHCPQYGRFSS
jgi:hypothetical protein